MSLFIHLFSPNLPFPTRLLHFVYNPTKTNMRQTALTLGRYRARYLLCVITRMQRPGTLLRSKWEMQIFFWAASWHSDGGLQMTISFIINSSDDYFLDYLFGVLNVYWCKNRLIKSSFLWLNFRITSISAYYLHYRCKDILCGAVMPVFNKTQWKQQYIV